MTSRFLSNVYFFNIRFKILSQIPSYGWITRFDHYTEMAYSPTLINLHCTILTCIETALELFRVTLLKVWDTIHKIDYVLKSNHIYLILYNYTYSHKKNLFLIQIRFIQKFLCMWNKMSTLITVLHVQFKSTLASRNFERHWSGAILQRY